VGFAQSAFTRQPAQEPVEESQSGVGPEQAAAFPPEHWVHWPVSGSPGPWQTPRPGWVQEAALAGSQVVQVWVPGSQVGVGFAQLALPTQATQAPEASQ
jgi:hypothetical protein